MAKDGPGRPEADIDWKKVDDLLIAGCTADEIAGYFGIGRNTLYMRCLSDNNLDYSTYSREKRRRGDTILRAHQFAKALGKTSDGDNTLLIWLGKTRLKQERSEKMFENKLKKDAELEVNAELMAKHQAFNDQISALRKERNGT